jgi:hypothetical protein
MMSAYPSALADLRGQIGRGSPRSVSTGLTKRYTDQAGLWHSEEELLNASFDIP